MGTTEDSLKEIVIVGREHGLWEECGKSPGQMERGIKPTTQGVW